MVPVTAVLTGIAVAALVVAVGVRPSPRRQPGAQRRRPTATAIERAGARLLERARPHAHHRRRDAQLPEALDRLAAALRAGQAIGPALTALAGEAPEPLRHDLEPVARSLAHGAPVAVALAGWAERPSTSSDVRLVVASLTLGAHAGGEVARAVDRLAATLRERREVQGEVRALSTQARTSAGLLAVAPVAFAGLVATIEPAAVAFLVTSPLGLACLLLGLGLEVLGATWMSRMTRSAA